MGKKRIAKKGETEAGAGAASSAGESRQVSSKRRVEKGVLDVQSTYNNTKLLLTDTNGNALAASSSGALGFTGAKKGTPFAAAKVGETVSAKAQALGIKDVSIIVKGVGSGREAAIRGFIGKSINVLQIKDATPVPFNGPKPPRPRRV